MATDTHFLGVMKAIGAAFDKLGDIAKANPEAIHNFT
jgi:hypothetical protein